MRTILLIIVIQVAVVILSSFFLIKKKPIILPTERVLLFLFSYDYFKKNFFSVNNTLSTGFLNKVIPAQWEAAAAKNYVPILCIQGIRNVRLTKRTPPTTFPSP